MGLGIGYEWTSIDINDPSLGNATVTYKGFEFANLQLGADFKASPQLRMGPFVSYSFGQFSKGDIELDGGSVSADITDKGTHTYFTIGVRGQFGL